MVRAILEGWKTQTRRIVKPQPEWDGKWFSWNGHAPGSKYGACAGNGLHVLPAMATNCKYGVPGDRLWVRETFAHQAAEYEWSASNSIPVVPAETWYRADFADAESHNKTMPWKPSIHMPRSASRITLEVTGVRVERLQDISEADARAEGVDRHAPGEIADVAYRAPFRSLWGDINGAGSWDANPWVWVVEFQRIS
jgi:hypothetical protein